MQNFDTVMTAVPPTTGQTMAATPSTAVVQQQPQPQQDQQQSTNSGNWFDLQIKSEPLNYHQHQLHPHHTLHHHQNHHHLHGSHTVLQQDTPLSNGHGHDHSSPTSPQSVDSMDSLSGKSGFFESKGTASLISGYNPLGFNPLTPPGYSGLLVPPGQQQHQQPGQPAQTRLSTPNRGYGKAADSVYTTNPALTPTHTPPMDVTPPKSPKET
uniref:Uncharacterized protein n=1 Tax=Anopheles atroparvus TaxID=41427 RepID=A0AAG5DLQ6_ANOAO